MQKPWLLFAVAVTVMWGLWGALTAMLGSGTPSTIIYSIWAVTMVIPCVIALKLVGWKLATDKYSILLGCTIGFLGSGGQMLLFHAVDTGPAYLIFPIVSLSPLITIVLSFLLLKERTGKLGTIGIFLALITLPLFEYSQGDESSTHNLVWFLLAISVMAAWGLQAFFMKFSNNHMNAESIFFYMTITALLLIPVAYFMTDTQSLKDFDFSTIPSIASIQILNSIGALCLVYAFRYGKAMVVSPLTNAGAPLISSILSILFIGVIPNELKILGIILAIIAAILLAIEPENNKSSN
ncbi:MAG: DMT family transporter [Pseudoalteromonas sp.]|uniref:DMT family transporter n=3 Tax=Pseudoalteromonas TaxID=53246 RepID=UPI003F9D1CE1